MTEIVGRAPKRRRCGSMMGSGKRMDADKTMDDMADSIKSGR